jgi:hypothetical protein
MPDDSVLPWIVYVNTAGLGLLGVLVASLMIAFLPVRNAPDIAPVLVGVVVAAGYLLTVKK